MPRTGPVRRGLTSAEGASMTTPRLSLQVPVLFALVLAVAAGFATSPASAFVAATSKPVPPPSGLSVTSATPSSIAIGWSASRAQLAGYGLYSNGVRVASVSASTLTYTFTALSCATQYTLGVDAVDRSGKRSAVVTAGASTSACAAQPTGDTQAPIAPTGLTQSGQSVSGLTVAWNASTDNVGTTGYGVYLNGSRVGSTSAAELTFGFAGLSCGTSYTVGVDAVDAAGNRSAVASVVGFPAGGGGGGGAAGPAGFSSEGGCGGGLPRLGG